jgi:hypothetical protein
MGIVVNLLNRAYSAGLTLEACGDRLIVSGPEEAEPIVRELSEHKAEILAELRARNASPPSYPTAKELGVHKAAPQFHGVTTVQPAKVILNHLTYRVAVECGMWFFDRGGGWTCASNATAKRIEKELAAR